MLSFHVSPSFEYFLDDFRAFFILFPRVGSVSRDVQLRWHLGDEAPFLERARVGGSHRFQVLPSLLGRGHVVQGNLHVVGGVVHLNVQSLLLVDLKLGRCAGGVRFSAGEVRGLLVWVALVVQVLVVPQTSP